jgi:hypothetical protein
LTQDEINYLRARAEKKCISDSNGDFGDFISDSSSTMLGFDRDKKEWDFKYSASGQTHKIYIWKSTNSAVYFHIVTSGTSPKHIFLKYSTASNSALMKQVQADGCAGTDYTTSASSSTVTMKKDDPDFSTYNSDTKYKFFRTWNFKSSLPGFFGFMDYTLKKQFYNNSGSTVSTPAAITETHTITSVATPTDQSSDSYTSVDYPNRYYCLVTSYTTTQIDPVEVINGASPASNLTCDNTGDSPTVTVGTETFTPATELLSPF